MTSRFRKMNIRDKLVAALAGTAFIAFVFASTALLIFENLTLENRAREFMEPYAQLISVAAEAAVAFQEPRRAQEILNTLRANPQILEADIVLANNAILAGYNNRSEELVVPHTIKPEGLYLNSNSVELVQGLQGGAYLHLVMSPDQLNRDTQQILWLFAAGVLVLVVVMTGLLAVLQHTIVRPIIRLAKTTEQVRTMADYHQRAPASGSDEVARLGRSFNAMMTAIEERESELHRLNAELEQRVQQRTQELTEARDAAEVANRTKSTFLANMSHELRTPLNAILGYTQILGRSKQADSKTQNGLQIIQEAGEHLLSLINDILDLSKIEAGKIELECSSLYLQHFLSSVGDLIRIKAEEKGLIFQQKIAEDIPQVILADEARLRQVLLNMLSNAVKFTMEGKVQLHVRCLQKTKDKTTLFFEVSDTGVGIAKDKLETIFDPFEQVGNLQRLDGTGLGLAISSHLVKQLKGELKVESTLGQGSRFWFQADFPLAPESSIDEISQTWKLPYGYEGPKKSVLIVDDVQTNREVLTSLLVPLGFDISIAKDGQEALSIATHSSFDIILMDMIMPIMDGKECCRELRKHEATKDVFIIALSADSSDTNEESALEAGADAFLNKPIKIDKLITLLGKLLQLHWLQSNDEMFTENEQQTPFNIDVIELPPLVQLEQLLDIVKKGDINEINAQATQLSQQDERYQTFVNKLHKLANEFRSQAIIELVQKAIEKSKCR